MKTLILALMVWASAQTGLPVPDRLPEITYADPCQMERLYIGNPDLDCDSLRGFRIRAMYDPRIRRMVLPEAWRPDSLYDVSTLLHELVHHMQAEAGIRLADVECIGRDIERPAYEAQIAFLEAAGVKAFDVMGLNGLAYVFLTNCNQFGR